MIWNLTSSLRAQGEHYLDPWRWAHFTTENGLPDNRILDLLDLGDEAWVATHEGLAWFDGWTWHTVTEGVPRGTIQCITADSEGRVWVGTELGVHVGNRDGFRRLELPAPYGKATVFSIAHNVELQTVFTAFSPSERTTTVFQYVDGELRFFDIPDEHRESRNFEVVWTASGQVWILADRGLYQIENGEWKLRLSSDVPGYVLTELSDNQDGFGVASFRTPTPLIGLWEWSPGETPQRNFEEGRGVAAAADVAPNGEAIAVYESGEVRIRQSGQWSSLRPVPEPMDQTVMIRYRSNGDLWIASTQGLYLYRGEFDRWKQWRHRAVNSAWNRVDQVELEPDGSVWVGTAAGAAKLDSNGEIVPLPPLPDCELASTTGLGLDANGRVWTGSHSSYTGVHRWNGEQWQHFDQDDEGHPLGFIHRIRADRAGRVWLLGGYAEDSLVPQGAVVFVGDGDAIQPWKPIEELGSQTVFEFLEDSQGRYWFGTQAGVSRWTDGVWTHWELEGSWSGPTNRLVEAPDGSLWVGRYMAHLGRIGLDDEYGRVDSGGSTSLFEVYDMLYDEQGRLWLTSMNGLHVLRGETWASIDPKTGMAKTWLRELAVHDDKLFIGSLGAGLLSLDLTNLDAPAPRIQLGRPITETDRASLRWRADAWWGEVSSDRVLTRYRIDEEDWSDWSTQRELILTGLAKGQYRLQVQAMSAFGVVDSAGASQSFEIPTPFYEHALFRIPIALLSLAFLCLGMAFLRHRLRTAAKLRASEQEHRLMLEQASDAILISDFDGRFLRANAKACELLDRKVAQILTSDFVQLFRSKEGAEPGPMVEAIRSNGNGAALIDLQVLRESGELLPVETSANILGEERIQMIVRDLSERKRIEEERRAFERRVAESQRLESLGRLAGGVAHDFNNLLTVMIGGVELAQNSAPSDPEVRENFGLVRSAIDQATELTEQLLAYVGGGALGKQPLDLSELLIQIGDLSRNVVGVRIKLAQELRQKLPPVYADAVHVKQIVLNLLVNAVEAMEGKNGEIKLRTRTCRQLPADVIGRSEGTSRTASQWVVLEVIDQGVGMDAETRARIFDPFFTTKFEGRGLGLAAVLGILRAHDGFIRVQSELGRGSTFSVYLPASTEPIASLSPPSPRAAWQSSGTVLLIEDEAPVRQVTEGLLRQLGFEVLVASNGQEGIDYYRSRKEEIRVVLLDLTMPELDGVDTLEALRSIDRNAPVVLMSGFPERAAAERLEGQSPSAFVRKPFDLAALREVLHGALR